ncbi:queuosine precursor transporter [Candidatus Finniella inopinata]|uniref:Probable queuosine precursor transporter n=1 Tax=Candidatus Finniella inopinata TaxID=1696036 RepID=A0A4Q7DGV6_9PROT|nr:queuosine precursor transporter [Candidatus Finniella inopinata]RZI46131.1 VUT family protein [Candidatus Finniella inopinata]
MTTAEKIYTSLCILFSVLLVIGNLTYQKFVSLPLPFHTFQLSVGAVLYPLTFLLTDLIAEFYGKERANFCVRFAIIVNTLAAFIIAGMSILEATRWSKIDDATFHKVFGFYSIAFMGSLIACYTAQAVDIILYLWIRKLTNGKHLWLRNNGSTAISLFIDTTIVIGFMTAFGILPPEHMSLLIYNSYLYKLFFTICSTPLFYGGVWVMTFATARTTPAALK